MLTNVALVIGRGKSSGLPGKNLMKLFGRPMMSYPILAALHSKSVERVYLSTDDEDMMEVGKVLGAELITRPDELATNEALAEDAFIHGFHEIVERRGGRVPDMVTLLFCNGVSVLPEYIDEAWEILSQQPSYDSVSTVSEYNMWSPLRAKKIDENGLVTPFLPLETWGSPEEQKVNCDRSSQGSVWYADCSMFVVRPRCFEKKNGDPPFTWLGRKCYPIKQWGGLDVDYHWQVPMAKYWLEQHGFSDSSTPYQQGVQI